MLPPESPPVTRDACGLSACSVVAGCPGARARVRALPPGMVGPFYGSGPPGSAASAACLADLRGDVGDDLTQGDRCGVVRELVE